MSTTTVFHNMTQARAALIHGPGDAPWGVTFDVFDTEPAVVPALTILIHTVDQADALIKAGLQALDMLTQDNDPGGAS